MKLSTETYVLREKFGDKAAIEMIKNAGFDCYDYSMYWTKNETDMLGENYRELAFSLREYANSIGIECNQAHAPFDLKRSDEFDLSNENYQRLVRSLEVASILGAKTIVIHSVFEPSKPVIDKEFNKQYYEILIPYCEKFKINVSVENLFKRDKQTNRFVSNFETPKKHIEFVNSLNSDFFNICIDVGHCAVVGQTPEETVSAMTPALLKSLHIHDNDFTNDRHCIPYLGKLNWDNICRSLSEINYSEDLTLEIFGTLNKLDSSLLPAALCFAEKVGRHLIEKIENNK